MSIYNIIQEYNIYTIQEYKIIDVFINVFIFCTNYFKILKQPWLKRSPLLNGSS